MRQSFFSIVLAILTLAVSALALDPGPGGWYHTGDSVRVKKIAFVSVKVYAIGHDMKCLPSAKSKQAVIDADCDKKLTWTMKRDVDKGKITDALKEAYQMNGYGDAAKIAQALGAFSADLKENATVTISYDSTKKTTTITEQNGSSATIAGVDFMKGTWSIWFGKIDQSSLGDELISKL